MNARRWIRAGIAAVSLLLTGLMAMQPAAAQSDALGDAVPHGISKAGILGERHLPGLPGVTIPVLRREVFRERFGSNPEIPRTGREVLRLARRLYAQDGSAPSGREECGEHDQGVLFAALQNPDLEGDVGAAIGALALAGAPNLERTYTSGHFRFFYTDNDPDPNQNVTLADVQATATVLNAAFDDFAENFRTPAGYQQNGVRMIDVRVYDLPDGVAGQTTSTWNYIELDSRQAVADPLRRQTTPVHELFHRVQYAYGLSSGTSGLKWVVEGTAAWSQKYRASHVGDWMSRMNSGLRNPDTALIDRSYDACLFWVYLGERAGNEAHAIRDVWQTWSSTSPIQSGQNVGWQETMRQAVDTVIKRRIGSSLDQLAARWAFANYAKDFPNVYALYDYEEDEWMRVWGATVYGPLASVSPITANLTSGVLSGAPVTFAGNVQRYGADYYVFNVPPRASRVRITATASDNGLAYGFIESRGGQITNFTVPLTVGETVSSYVRDLTPGQVDQIAVIIIGSPNSGAYQLRVQATPSVGPDPLGGPLADRVMWSSWENLFFDDFFYSLDDPAVILNADGRLEVFVRGIDNALYHRRQASPEPSAPWSGTYRLGGVMGSKPVAVRTADGRIEVFYRGADNALWHQWQLVGGGWSAPQSLGGYLTSDPAVAQNADGRLEVFVIGGDAALWHKWQGYTADRWSDWYSLGGYCVGNPAVGRNQDGRLEVFVRGAFDTLWHRWQLGSTPAWSEWAYMGIGIVGDPVVTPNGDGRLELFFRGADGVLYHVWQWQPSGAWSSFHSLGGYILGNPAAALGGDGKLAVFVRGGDNAVWVKLQGGPIAGWTDWFPIGGEVSGSPVALQYAHGNPGVHVRAADGSTWRRYQR